MPKNRTERYSHKKTGDALDAQAREYEAKLAALREEAKVDGPVFNAGRSEGHSDVAARLRAIVDPKDLGHLSLDGLLQNVEQRMRDLETLRATKSAEINERVRIAEQKARDLETLWKADQTAEKMLSAKTLRHLAEQLAETREQLAHARESLWHERRKAHPDLKLGTTTGRMSGRTPQLANAPRPAPGCPVCLGTGLTCSSCGAARGDCAPKCRADAKTYGAPGFDRCTHCGGEG